jgi:hypothetical protein
MIEAMEMAGVVTSMNTNGSREVLGPVTTDAGTAMMGAVLSEYSRGLPRLIRMLLPVLA